MATQEPAVYEGKWHALRAFRHRNFALFFTGQTVSLFGTWSQSLAMSWLVWRITDSAIWLGVIGFTIQFPMLILGLLGGVFADRHDRLKMLVFLQTLCMLQAIILATLTLTHNVELWHIFALGVMLGSIYAFEFPTRQAFIMDMVGKSDLLTAVSLQAATVHATRMAGPMIAGFIVAWKGEGICFLFNAFTFLALIGALMFVDRKKLITQERTSEPFWDSIKEGLRYLKDARELKLAIALMGFVALFCMPLVYIMPIFADQIFGGTSIELGWLMGAGAGGSLIGAMYLANRKTSYGLLHMASIALGLAGIALIVFSHLETFWVALIVVGISNMMMTITISSSITLLQHLAPNRLRGRMVSFFTTVFMGFAPFGSIVGGFSSEYIGAPKTILLCGLGAVIAGFLATLRSMKLNMGSR